eukprot:6159598-Prymnesium_polylepis.1
MRGARTLPSLLLLLCRASAALDCGTIARGEIFVTRHWLSRPLLDALRADVVMLRRQRGAFVVSGLTVTERSRVIEDPEDCDADGVQRSRLCCVWRPGLRGDASARRSVDRLLDGLRGELEAVLQRRLSLAEQYYSVTPAGSRLAWHMDERHEETKGEEAWEQPSRRSISWLLYLSGDGWDEAEGAGAGGGLRAYPKRSVAQDGAACGAHDGDLQVGWLERAGGAVDPVFLDAWLRPDEPDGQPECALYRVVAAEGRREYVTRRIRPGDFGGAGVDAGQFGEMLRELLPAERRRGFCSVQRRPDATLHDTVDVSPAGGTLVLFDSVSVGHEVLPVVHGERVALAGWFHERQQEWPGWY